MRLRRRTRCAICGLASFTPSVVLIDRVGIWLPEVDHVGSDESAIAGRIWW